MERQAVGVAVPVHIRSLSLLFSYLFLSVLFVQLVGCQLKEGEGKERD